MSLPIFYPLVSAVPLGILAVTVKAWRWLGELRALRAPFKEKLLRSPGETARRHKEESEDRVTGSLIWVTGFPPLLALCYLVFARSVSAPSAGLLVTFILLTLIGYGALLVRFLLLLEERNRWRMDFLAEKTVGEELNRLMAEGCLVFHDLPLEQNGNIAHVVVSSSGVYAVDTRTWKKGEPTPKLKQKPNEVIYDGKGLQFPDRYDKELLIRARHHARNLSDLLSHGLGSSVPVKPMLTLPGWAVSAKGAGDVTVLTPKMIRTAILTDAPGMLSAEQMKLVASQLESRCRDVEF